MFAAQQNLTTPIQKSSLIEKRITPHTSLLSFHLHTNLSRNVYSFVMHPYITRVQSSVTIYRAFCVLTLHRGQILIPYLYLWISEISDKLPLSHTTQSNRDPLWKPILAQPVELLFVFYETLSFNTVFTQSVTDSYAEPYKSNPYPRTLFLEHQF